LYKFRETTDNNSLFVEHGLRFHVSESVDQESFPQTIQFPGAAGQPPGK